MSEIRESIAEQYLEEYIEYHDKGDGKIDSILFLGTSKGEYDNAILGVDETSMRLIYSVRKILDVLEEEYAEDVEDDDDVETMAMEWLTYNIIGGYIGTETPIWCWDLY